MTKPDVLIVYNTCGVSRKEKVDNYIASITSLLTQKNIDHHVVLSACLQSDPIRQRLEGEFGSSVSYNWIYDLLPVNITMNDTVNEMIWATEQDYEAYFYIDSGVRLKTDNDAEHLMSTYMEENSPPTAMVSCDSTSDNGFQPWLHFDRPPHNPFKIPLGRACHPHLHLIGREIQQAYGRVWPDIFASYCTESTLTFLAAAIGCCWMLNADVLVEHWHGMDGASSGFLHEQGAAKAKQGDGRGLWDHTFHTNRSMREILQDSRIKECGFGYEEIQGILPHDPSKYDELGRAIGTALYEFIKDSIFLKSEEFDYTKITRNLVNNVN